uniref:odorant receptor 82a-like n=1 Tax=Osmia lignaria TaxID=473952 RepID=UPI00147937DF|nr:odorant receptor 82a-like [Osmia lignaria]
MLCINVKLQTIFDHDYLKRKQVTVNSEFKNCIIYHQLLILYVKRLECTFRFPLLGQLVISSIVLSISGFQLCMIDWSMKRLLFFVYFFGAIFQIYLITYNSKNIIVESNAVGEAIYSYNWETSSYKDSTSLERIYSR